MEGEWITFSCNESINLLHPSFDSIKKAPSVNRRSPTGSMERVNETTNETNQLEIINIDETNELYQVSSLEQINETNQVEIINVDETTESKQLSLEVVVEGTCSSKPLGDLRSTDVALELNQVSSEEHINAQQNENWISIDTNSSIPQQQQQQQQVEEEESMVMVPDSETCLEKVGVVDNKRLLCLVEDDKSRAPWSYDLEWIKERLLAQRQANIWNRTNYHPMQDIIYFKEDDHKYYLNGSRRNIISLTQFISCFFKPFDADKESNRMINSKNHMQRVHQKSYAYQHCYSSKDIRDKWDHRRDLGTLCHKNIELLLNGVPLEQQIVDPENEACVKQFLQLYEDKTFWDWNVFWTEQPLCYPPALLAGTPDIIIQSKENPNELGILDLKRCPSINFVCYGKAEYGYGPCSHIANTKMNLYALQQSGLKFMLESYGYTVKYMFLIGVHPSHKKGKAHVIPVQDFTQDFANMIQYRQDLLRSNHILPPIS
jgi:hypothetical protein